MKCLGWFGGSHVHTINGFWNANYMLQTDSYKEIGYYNLLCSGFIQTNNKIAISAHRKNGPLIAISLVETSFPLEKW